MKLTLFLWLCTLQAPAVDRAEPAQERLLRLAETAAAIEVAAKGDPARIAFLAVQAKYESGGFRSDVQRCECKAHECDRGKAHGLWQIHRAPAYPAVWDSVCGVSGSATRAGAEWILWAYYDPRNLTRSFARMGGIRAPHDAKWAVQRAKEARQLASQL